MRVVDIGEKVMHAPSHKSIFLLPWSVHFASLPRLQASQPAWCLRERKRDKGKGRRVCELGICKHCREWTHGPGVGVALEPAVTATVKAAIRSCFHKKKVIVPVTLKINENEAHAQSQGENAARHRWSRNRE